MNLKDHFITPIKEYCEGDVFAFRQNIKTTSKIISASLQITALGVFFAKIDGEKIGDEFLAPGYTYYPHNLHTRTYDVTSYIKNESTLCVYLGQGWYCGRFTFENKIQIYGSMPAISWILNVKTEDGDKIYYSSDNDVKCTNSEYVYAGLYDGEIIDENYVQVEYKTVKVDNNLPDVLEESNLCIRMKDEIGVKDVIEHKDYTIIDFGCNFAGVVSINPQYLEGEEIRIRHGEILNEDGSLYVTNLRKAKQTIIYKKGKTNDIYTPQFTYMGFRYIEITGCKYKDGLITAHEVYSDMERTGYFDCDNPYIKTLYENQVRSQKSNYIEVPTDCPQRDERMGYTGDGQVYAETGAFNFNTLKFWEKFLKDIRYSQKDSKTGYVTPTVPATPGKNEPGFMSMLGWGNCVCIVPQMLYNQYGDISIIEKQYDSMKSFCECEISKMGGIFGKKNLWIAPSLGDWLSLGCDFKYMALHNGPVSNAFLVNDMKIMAWASKMLDKKEDEEKYQMQYLRSKESYIKAFITKDGKMKDDYQGAYILALAYVLDKGELWTKVYNNLVTKIKNEGMQTGFFATEKILPLLTDNGDISLAFDLLFSETCPSWLYQVKLGATSMWERWDGIRPDGKINESKMSSDNMVSFNHYSFGSVGKFFYKYILGISPLAPGFSNVKIEPHIDTRLGSFNGSYQTKYGKISVVYDSNDNQITIDTCVDSLIVISGNTFKVTKGKYSYNV